MRGILIVQSDNEAEVPRGSDHKQLYTSDHRGHLTPEDVGDRGACP